MIRAWTPTPLGELCELVNGRAFKPEEWGKTGLPIVRIQNLNEPSKPFNYFAGPYSKKHLARTGDVLLSWSGTPGTSFGCFIWNRGDALVNQHIFKVEVRTDSILPEFFVYSVNNILSTMIELAHGAAGLRHITKAKLEKIQLLVPPLETQQRVVSRIKECMERVTEIEKDTTRIASELDALFPAILNETFSAMKKYPIVTLDKAAEIRGGSSLPEGSTIDAGPSSALLVKVGDMNAEGNERVIQTSREYISTASAGRSLINRSAVVFPKRGGAIATNKKRLLGRPALIDPNLMAIEAKQGVITPDYLYFWSLTLDLSSISNGGVIPQLNRKDLVPLEIPVPDTSVQARLVHDLQRAESHCLQLKAEFSAAQIDREHLRKSILRKAFAGDL